MCFYSRLYLLSDKWDQLAADAAAHALQISKMCKLMSMRANVCACECVCARENAAAGVFRKGCRASRSSVACVYMNTLSHTQETKGLGFKILLRLLIL